MILFQIQLSTGQAIKILRGIIFYFEKPWFEFFVLVKDHYICSIPFQQVF